jgi:hypothetical protein
MDQATAEAAVCKRFQRARAALASAEKAVEAHYWPRLQALLAQDDLAGAEALVYHRMPTDCVTTVWAWDQVREYRRRHGLPERRSGD